VIEPAAIAASILDEERDALTEDVCRVTISPVMTDIAWSYDDDELDRLRESAMLILIALSAASMLDDEFERLRELADIPGSRTLRRS